MNFLRLFRRRPVTSPAPVTAFSPVGVTAGTRWLRCDTTACAHLTFPHTPEAGGFRCTECGHLKGDQPC